jgi:Cu(I)/Ag(I) efflux system membrane protein CusA/SilA
MINRLIEFSLKNRFIIIAFYILIALWGVWALKNTPVDAIPDLSENQVIVFTDWSGRSPKEVEDQITYPLVTNLQGLAGVSTTRAASAFGFSMVTVIFRDDVDNYFARTRVLERLNLVAAQLPMGVVPTLGPDATGLGQIFMYYLESDGSYNLGELRAIQDWFVRYQINSVPGVAEVGSIGGHVRQYQVDIDPNKLRTYNVSAKMVVEAVMRSNTNVGAKVVEASGAEMIVRGLGLIQNISDVENIVVTSHQGVPVYVRNLGRVQLGPDFRRGVLDQGGQEVVGGVVVMRYGENTLEVIHRVKAKLEEIKPALPKGITIKPFYDRTGLIHDSINTLKSALTEETILVIVVCIIFLMHFRSFIIIASSLPLAILIAFLLMKYTGTTSNIMSLGGIAIAIGVLVDAGIVMVENVVRHVEQAHNPSKIMDITSEAAKMVGRPIFFAMVIIILGFVPVFALTGMEGKLFHPLAFTKTFAMMGATILAVTWVPVLCTYLIRGKVRSEEENPIMRRAMKVYSPALHWALEHKKLTVIIAIAATVGTFALVPFIGKEFMPPLDEGSIMFMPTMLPSVSLTQANEVVKLQDKIIQQIPEVAMVTGKVGRAETATDPAPISMVETIVVLKPKKEWRKGMTKQKIIDEMDKKLSLIPGVANGYTQPIAGRIDMLSTGIRTQVGVKIFGPDIKVLEQKAQEIEDALRKVPGAVDLYAERILGSPYLEIDIDRAAVARYGIAVGDVQDVIEMAIGGKNLTTTIEGRQRFPVRVRYAREFREDIEALKRVLVASPTGAQIPLAQLARIQVVMGPAMISSENGQLRAFVQLNVRNRDLGGFVDEAKAVLAKEVKLPPGYFITWSGQYEHQVRAKQRLMIIVPVVFFVIFILLYLTYNTFSGALLVMGSIPFAMVGGILLVFILGYNMSVAVWVGFIALFGTAVQTGVVMIIYLDEAFKRKGHINLEEAIFEGAVLRLRPKLMTVSTVIAGLMPIMWSTKVGSEVMKPIATPVIGGMISSTILVLIVIPVVYMWLKERELAKEKDMSTQNPSKD